jgi:putative transposase
MKEAYPQLSLGGICWLFGISRQAHHKHNKQEKKSFLQKELILQMVREIRHIHPCIGTRKLIVLLDPGLNAHGIRIGRDALFALLRDNGMLIRKRRRKWITTWSNHPYNKYNNLIEGVQPERINQIWVSDITHLQTKAGYLYLSFITDAYSRKVVGYDIADNLESVNALQALKMAIKLLPKGPADLIHHSDRGSQYCCHEYVKELLQRGIAISMTQNSDPLENPLAERLNGIVKNEYLKHKPITSKVQAKETLKDTIMVYNKLRPHMSIGYKMPEEVYKKQLKVSRVWKNYYRKKVL